MYGYTYCTYLTTWYTSPSCSHFSVSFPFPLPSRPARWIKVSCLVYHVQYSRPQSAEILFLARGTGRGEAIRYGGLEGLVRGERQ